MRAILALALFLAGGGMAGSQEPMPRDEALKAAFTACQDLEKMLGTPIPTDPDVKRPVGVRAEGRGLMVLPESKLSLDQLAKAGAEVVPVGQLWLLKIAPTVEGRPANSDRLKTVNLTIDQGDVTLTLCALAVRKAGGGQPELLVYGKDKQPLLGTPLAKTSGKQENPIEVFAEREGDGAAVTLKILGSYTASFRVSACE